MVICAALKLHMKGVEPDIIVPCYRHALGYELLRDVEFNYNSYDVTEGFLITDGSFMDRKESFQHAKSCGQLPCQIIIDKGKEKSDELYSEDLY